MVDRRISGTETEEAQEADEAEEAGNAEGAAESEQAEKEGVPPAKRVQWVDTSRGC